MSRARQTYADGEHLMSVSAHAGAVNRFYYSAFHAARSLLATLELDSSRHKGAISLFQMHFVKTGIITTDAGCVPSCAGKCGGVSDGCGGTCPDPCNGHGTCNAGVCTCTTGYQAPSCNSCAAGYSGYPNEQGLRVRDQDRRRAGQADWRLPDRYELRSIADYGRVSPSIDATTFPATPNNYFWRSTAAPVGSSSSYAGGPTNAWVVDFDVGNVANFDKTNTYYVRCVRGGP
ncbi:MAG: DUF1566 domain-containing protein [Deltaproteobacteria bacterium]|nr:DUF1566 domain-containing protein [Deltaproteobacteria bacterium]